MFTIVIVLVYICENAKFAHAKSTADTDRKVFAGIINSVQQFPKVHFNPGRAVNRHNIAASIVTHI